MNNGVIDQIPFEVEKEECLVTNDRSAQIEAKGPSAAFRILVSVGFDERIDRAQLVVLEVEEAPAAEQVRARLGDGIDDDARRSAVLGGVLVRQYLELGHRVERDARLRARSSTVGV